MSAGVQECESLIVLSQDPVARSNPLVHWQMPVICSWCLLKESLRTPFSVCKIPSRPEEKPTYMVLLSKDTWIAHISCPVAIRFGVGHCSFMCRELLTTPVAMNLTDPSIEAVAINLSLKQNANDVIAWQFSDFRMYVKQSGIDVKLLIFHTRLPQSLLPEASIIFRESSLENCTTFTISSWPSR